MPSFQSSSIVRERFHGILAAGQPRGIACAKHGSNQSNESGAQNPFRRNQNRKRGKESEKPCPDKVTESHASRNTQDAQEGGFHEEGPNDQDLAGAEGFQDANVAGAFEHGGGHGEEDNQKADGNGEGDHGVDEGLQAGDIRRGHQGHEFLERPNRMIGKQILDFGDDVFGVIGVRALYEEDGGLIVGADKILQGGEGDEQARALAVLNDSRNVPFVIEEIISVANLHMLGLGLPIVHQNVVGVLQIMALQEDKAAGDVAERLGIDAPDGFHAARRVELQESRGDSLNVFEFRQSIRDFDGHGRAAEGDEHLCGWRLHHDVRANTLDALGGFLKNAGGEANDEDDQSHLHGNRHHADQRAHRPVKQVPQDELSHHGFLSSAASPRCTISSPGGGSSLKRSASSGSFRLIFSTLISRRYSS